jgi:tetratricopeptide (TPR) repeat protein
LAFSDGSPKEPYLWFEQAILCLAVGDAAGYGLSCRNMLKVLGSNDELVWLELAAHACVLAPDGPAQKGEALLLAQRRALVIPGSWSDHVLGLALYRAGRFAEADALLQGSLDRDPGWDFRVLDWLDLAMADQRLGRTDEARRWLERAERWVAPRLYGRPGGADRAVPENWNWRDGVQLHLLLREARALISAGLTELPADVFAPN